MLGEDFGGIVLTGQQTRYAQLLAWRAALKLEARGMRHSRQSILSRLRNSALELTDQETGEVLRTIDPIVKSRTAIKAHAELNALIMELLGEEFDNPLPADFKRIM
jgi:hypothetical protein